MQLNKFACCRDANLSAAAAEGCAVRMQDPVHYPHGTKFMAPGPMGQCFPVPDDEGIKHQMITTAENQQKIYRMYNFDYNTQVCQSVLWLALWGLTMPTQHKLHGC